MTTILTLAFGILGGLGLLCLTHSFQRRVAEIFVMIPSLVPVLFVIVASLNFVQLFMNFPFGLGGVVLIHVIMNVGLVSVATARLIGGSMGGVIELATVEGASRWQILKVILGGLKWDLAILSFLIFSLAFTSFSVPLIVGAGRGDTLEVLIYRAVLGQGDLGYGVGLALVQIFILALFSFVLRKPLPSVVKLNRNLSRLQMWPALLILLGTTLIVLFSSLSGVHRGFLEILGNGELKSRVLQYGTGTFIECVSVGILVFVGLFLVSYRAPHRVLNRVFLAYSAPSAVIIGLAVYLIFNAQAAPQYQIFAWVSFGFVVTIFPMLYRFRAAGRIASVENQIATARVLGASHELIFSEILLPQLWRDFAFLAGIAALWASGDFALSSLIAGRELTLAMMAQTLLGGYRTEVATVITWYSLFIGVFVFLIFEAVGRVGYSKSHS
ncbi:MAG: hypothetical protein KDD38_08010 [Bdellovibrionales bacterium]|nr:hypothetical protein [Bdellovibrionales bacterium]